MSRVDLFGFASVTLMVIFDSLEDRHHLFRVAFALGCFAAAYYAYLTHNPPFMAVEAVWGLIALFRWRERLAR